jgi:cytochrome c oxidase subunit 2
VLTALTACGIGPAPSAFDPQGPRAARIASLGWFMVVLATIIFLITAGTLLYALFRRRSGPVGGLGPADLRGAPDAARWVVIGGIILPAVVLAGLMAYTIYDMSVLAPPAKAADLAIQVIGRQFWWEVRYPGRQVVTANEIHVPVGRSVELDLSTEDVIHSFWVPQLQGKMDLIPGKLNTFWLEAGRPGIYRGQCAEFCGIQHAHMALYVIADEPAAFDAWLDAQRQPAAQSSDPLVQRGAQVFAREGCISCHSIRAGSAGAAPVGGNVPAPPTGGGAGNPGPDLTHLAARQTIAAGMLPNNRGNLGGWIENSQAIKPGNKMPPMQLDGESLQALLTYLESLK